MATPAMATHCRSSIVSTICRSTIVSKYNLQEFHYQSRYIAVTLPLQEFHYQSRYIAVTLPLQEFHYQSRCIRMVNEHEVEARGGRRYEGRSS